MFAAMFVAIFVANESQHNVSYMFKSVGDTYSKIYLKVKPQKRIASVLIVHETLCVSMTANKID